MYLIDTHILIWYLTGNPKLVPENLKIIEDVNHKIFVSIVSIWEISIKVSIQKLQLPVPLEDFINFTHQLNIHILPISEDAMLHLASLPLHHKDPFDRLILSEGICHQIPLMSADKVFDLYDVERIW
ncbi:MAG: type II toxin-antitoxin system VapC family toxin [Bacteroidota bacterium]